MKGTNIIHSLRIFVITFQPIHLELLIYFKFIFYFFYNVFVGSRNLLEFKNEVLVEMLAVSQLDAEKVNYKNMCM